MSGDLSAGQWIGGIIGAVIGGYITRSPQGVAQGFALGAGIGGYIDPPPGPNLRGPTLDDKSFQSSAYGVQLPEVYGTFGFSGNIIYLENNEYKAVAKKESTGGKGGGGGGTYETTTYFATFAVAISQANPNSVIRRIWAGGKLIYSSSSTDIDTIIESAKMGEGFAYYDGSQEYPDSRIEAVLGVGNAPSYSGTAYIIFYDFDLTEYGNGLTGCQIKVEIVSASEQSDSITNASIVSERRFSFSDESRALYAASIRPLYGELSSAAQTTVRVYIEGDPYWGVISSKMDRFGSVITSDPSDPHVVASFARGYSEKATFGYGESHGWDGDNYYHRVVTDNGSFSLPKTTVWFTDNIYHYNRAEFQRIFQTSFGDFAILRTNGEMELYEQNRNYFVNNGNYSQLILMPTDYDIKGTCIIPGYVVFYSHSPQELHFYNVGDFGFSHTLALSGSTHAPQCAMYQNGYIYHVNSRRADIAGGNLIFSKIKAATGERQTKSLSVTPCLNSSENINFFPSINRKDGIIGMSFPDGDRAVRVYLVSEVGGSGNVDPIPANLADVVSALAKRAAVDESMLDVEELEDDFVDGYLCSIGGSVRADLSPLQVVHMFDLIEDGYSFKAIKRGLPSVAEIPYSNIIFDGGAVIKTEQNDTSQLPSRYFINYIDINREYEAATEHADHPSSALNERTVQLPVVITADKAAQLADTFINLSWIERPLSFKLPQTFLSLKVADIVDVEVRHGVFKKVRIDGMSRNADQTLNISAKYAEQTVYQSSAVGSVIDPPVTTIPSPGIAVSILVDAPMVIDSTDYFGFAAGMYGNSNSWPGGVLMRSTDAGQTYTGVQAFYGKTTTANAINSIGENDGYTIDRDSVLTITPRAGQFFSITESQMMTGQNYVAYGVGGRWEIMQYASSVLNGDGNYELSVFARGMRGTEWATGLHEDGDTVILLSDPDNGFVGVDAGSLLVSRLYKSVSVGASIDSADAETFKYSGVNLKPLSPVLPVGEIVSDDWLVSWTGRTRYSSSYWYSGNQPQNETVMSWDIEIIDGLAVVRTINTLTPNFIYTLAEQTEDFGSAQSSITVKIYQRSERVGRGFMLEVTL